ncbi:uncharacterized protein L969DRAFT_256570 [Mixia osmundae IAM 14324]|uniref:Transcription initiation factor TFIID subunit 10 n=1 Tax=Mixia osmundae (strain CBS 9802 / IAM 14324 / JCM 22182 / KY 12970) TaxID=764103 RepID=G7DW14_MIXOS|nr:uncharacterized protein L969DRAFT_256570 [Mixia osmundae IAM 14324]KEI36480.1 hypothetical protein L969DRAFT_256570 [Mixia osmundae IAM 14324]GAA94820.1 hypothetical protein E5Q_01474 [Mixia osmundae IAM 14324]
MNIDPSLLSSRPGNAATGASTSTDAPTQAQLRAEATRNEHNEDLTAQERDLAHFLTLLSQDDAKPLIPDEVTDYYLARAGFECDDVRVKRLVALATQKFVADIATDAYQYARTRTQATPALARGKEADVPRKTDKSKTVLTIEDLSAALAEYGVNATRAPYYL